MRATDPLNPNRLFRLKRHSAALGYLRRLKSQPVHACTEMIQ